MSKRVLRRLLGTAVVVGAVSSLAACGASGGSGGRGSNSGSLEVKGETIASTSLMNAARKEGTLVLYDNYPEQQWKEVLKDFTDDTDIEVNSVRLVTPQIYERVVSEKSGGKTSADVASFGDPTLMTKLMKQGYLSSYTGQFDDELPAEGRSNGDYTTYMRIAMVPVANSKEVSRNDRPTSWSQLLSGKYSGEIGLTPITAGGSSFAVYHFLDDMGPKTLSTLHDQKPRIYQSVVPLSQDLIRGEISLGVSAGGTTLQQVKDGAPLTPLYMSEGTPVFQNIAGLVKGSEHPNAAKVYINWLTSKRGGESIVENTSEYSVREDVPGPKVDGINVPASDSAKLTPPTAKDWQQDRDRLISKWESIFGG